MTSADTESATPAPDADDEFRELGEQLLRTATSTAYRAAVQALIEEQTILSVRAVRHALIVDSGRARKANFEGLSGRQYNLGLDPEQHAFLDLVLSMVSIGRTNICVVQDLDDRRLPIILRAILRLAGNEDLAVGRRL
ncbi:hypothetical protein [Streptomyces afghaniensis]|uniref:hypothetical protein n=1 Tax=Streptomyces afghaniensis TaxID=66865 RepID=UPI0037BB324A